MKKIMLLFFFIFTACAGRIVYTHPTKTEADLKKDMYECEKIAQQTNANFGFSGLPVMTFKEQDRCLESRGWTKKRVYDTYSSKKTTDTKK